MSRRKEPAMLNDFLDQLPEGNAAGDSFVQGVPLDSPTKTLTVSVLNAEMGQHLTSD